MENSLNEVGLSGKTDDGNVGDDLLNWTPGCITLTGEEYDTLTREDKNELNDLLGFPNIVLDKYTPEERVDLITNKYKINLEKKPFLKELVENDGVYKKSITGYSDIKNEFLKLVDVDNIQEEIDKLKKRITDKDIFKYLDVVTECTLRRDRGYKRLDDDGLYYTYFMSMEHCRNHVFEGLGYIQIYGKDGLYNVNSKMVDGYRKSLNILKRLKVLQIKTVKGKETYSFEGLDKFYFIDELNKNYKLTWNPNKDKMFTENKVDYFNEYTPIQYQGIDHGKDLSPVYYHIEHYLCSDNKPVYNYFISIISDMIRNPGRKLPVCIVMNGEGGVGKSFLFDKLFRKLFGDMYGFRSNKISGKFNKELENKVCFLIEELSHQDNKNESNIIKDMISNPRIRIERKGMDSYEIENCIRFFICSNGDWSVRIENNNSSRRYLVCDVSEEIPDYEYFNRLSELIKGDKRKGYEDEKVLQETIEQFIYDMGKIDLSVLEQDPPETESKKISQSYSKGIPEKQLEGFFDTILNNEGYLDNFQNLKILDPDNDMEINSTFFWNYFTEYLKERRQPVPDGFNHYGRILSKWFGKNCSKPGTKVVNGKRSRILSFPKLETVENILSLD
jgi:hypothetical protein